MDSFYLSKKGQEIYSKILGDMVNPEEARFVNVPNTQEYEEPNSGIKITIDYIEEMQHLFISEDIRIIRDFILNTPIGYIQDIKDCSDDIDQEIIDVIKRLKDKQINDNLPF